MLIVRPHGQVAVAYRQAQFADRKVVFALLDLSVEDWRFELRHDPAHPKSVEVWRQELGADVVWNAAYFKEDLNPAGFFKVTGGQSVVPWPTFEQQKDEHDYTFMITIHPNDLELRYLPPNPQSEPHDATLLSFPTLLVNGAANVKEDSELHAERTVVAEDAAGHDYLIVTKKGSLSLYELAKWLDEQPENFVIAGNLDGGPSTGLSLENEKHDLEIPSGAVPSVIVGYRSE